MSRPIQEPVSGYSPFYGCGIMVAAAIIFGGIIAWSAYSLFKQNSEIDQFTVAVSSLPELPPLSPEATQALAAKTAALQKTITAGQPASLSLTLAELNALIASAPDLGNGSYAEIVRFIGTEPEKTNSAPPSACRSTPCLSPVNPNVTSSAGPPFKSKSAPKAQIPESSPSKSQTRRSPRDSSRASRSGPGSPPTAKMPILPPSSKPCVPPASPQRA